MLPWPHIDPAKAIPWVEARAGIMLAESQRAALRLALLSKVLVITGGPGVGKTTLINSILKVLGAKGIEIALAAPPDVRPSGSARVLAGRPRPSIVCSTSIPGTAASSAMRRAR